MYENLDNLDNVDNLPPTVCSFLPSFLHVESSNSPLPTPNSRLPLNMYENLDNLDNVDNLTPPTRP